MKKFFLGIGILTGIAVIGLGMAKLLKEQVRLMFSYCYRIKNVVIRSFKKDNVDLRLDFLLRNQSDITLDILSYDFDVYLEGIKVGKLKDDNANIVWKARDISLIGANINFNPSTVFNASNLTTLLAKAGFNYKQLGIRMNGIVSVKHGFIKAKNIPLDMTMTIEDIMKDDPALETCTV